MTILRLEMEELQNKRKISENNSRYAEVVGQIAETVRNLHRIEAELLNEHTARMG